MIVSALFYGSILGGSVGGFLSDRFGGYSFMLLAMGLHVLGSVLIPLLAANAPYWAVAICRAIIGVGFVSVICLRQT